MQSNAELTVEPGSCRMHVRYNASLLSQKFVAVSSRACYTGATPQEPLCLEVAPSRR